jgi:hypothetical protein
VCFSSDESIGYGATLENYLRESFQFLIDQPHQAIILHLEENPMNSVDIRQVERVIDDVCVEFANKTAGIYWFDAGNVSVMEFYSQFGMNYAHSFPYEVSLDIHKEGHLHSITNYGRACWL